MASGKTTTNQANTINNMLRNTQVTATSGYLALFSTAPTEAGGGTELTAANGYARIAVGLGAPASGVSTNAGTITFTASGAAWAAIVGHAIYDASSAGNMLYYEDTVSGPTLADGDSYEFDPADVTVTET